MPGDLVQAVVPIPRDHATPQRRWRGTGDLAGDGESIATIADGGFGLVMTESLQIPASPVNDFRAAAGFFRFAHGHPESGEARAQAVARATGRRSKRILQDTRCC